MDSSNSERQITVYGPQIRGTLVNWVQTLDIVDPIDWVSINFPDVDDDEEVTFQKNYKTGYNDLKSFLDDNYDKFGGCEIISLRRYDNNNYLECYIGVIIDNQNRTPDTMTEVDNFCNEFNLPRPKIFTAIDNRQFHDGEYTYTDTIDTIPEEDSDSESNTTDNSSEEELDTISSSEEPDAISEEDSTDFSDFTSDSESISDDIKSCSNESVISLEPFDINSDDVFTMYYLNNSNKFTKGICVSKSEMKDYIKSEEDESPSLFTTIWKGGDESGVGGNPTCKFIVKMPPNNIWITLGSFDKMMNSSEKNWYLLPLYSNKKRRIGYEYGISRNHGQIPGFKIYKVFTKEEIKNNVEVKETDEDYPLYVKDLRLIQLQQSINIIKSIKNHFL